MGSCLQNSILQVECPDKRRLHAIDWLTCYSQNLNFEDTTPSVVPTKKEKFPVQRQARPQGRLAMELGESGCGDRRPSSLIQNSSSRRFGGFWLQSRPLADDRASTPKSKSFPVIPGANVAAPTA